MKLPKIFRGAPKGVKKAEVTEDIDVCPAKVEHPSVGDGQHHFHGTPFQGEICCKCGWDKQHENKLSEAALKKFRQSYW